MFNDTIAAISTGLTESGIGIIRISGPESYNVIDKIFRTKSEKKINLTEPNRVHYGFIISSDVSRETLDEVLVINMKAPHSYTGEDTIEIDCHGGVLMMRRILENVIEAGARPAEPGEFTKRAFLNGRIDLSQAEAVIDVITAKNDDAVRASVSQLKGNISEYISIIRANILNDTAFIESALDDPEHYSLDGFNDVIKDHTEKNISELQRLIESFKRGKIIKEGINTVIIGKPNAGKSSLLNAILGEERAIVTQVPGTTRDTINESVSIGSITLNLMDTAGIRNTDDVVEKIGVERTLKSIGTADLILLVIDLSEKIDTSDNEIFDHINEIFLDNKADNNRKSRLLTVFNKSDLKANIQVNDVLNRLPENDRDYIIVSAKNDKGVDQLYIFIDKMFTEGNLGYNDQIVISSVRHLTLIKNAKKSLESVLNSIEMSMPEDMYTIDLMDAYKSLGEIIGEEVGEDLINEIFSKFCMGK